MTRLVLVLLLAAAPANAADILKNIDVFQLERAVDPQISPDGSRIAYERRAFDIMERRG
jgi:hypothetical protein